MQAAASSKCACCWFRLGTWFCSLSAGRARLSANNAADGEPVIGVTISEQASFPSGAPANMNTAAFSHLRGRGAAGFFKIGM